MILNKKHSLIKYANNVTSTDVFNKFQKKYNVAKDYKTYKDFIDKGDDRYTPENVAYELALDYNHNKSKWKSLLNFFTKGVSSLILPIAGIIAGRVLNKTNPKLGNTIVGLSMLPGPLTKIVDEYTATKKGLNVIQNLGGKPDSKRLNKNFKLNVLRNTPQLLSGGIKLKDANIDLNAVPQSDNPERPKINFNDPRIRPLLVGLGIGSTLGAGLGYVGSKGKDREKDKLKNTLKGIGIGGVGGTSAGFLYSNYKYPKMVEAQ